METERAASSEGSTGKQGNVKNWGSWFGVLSIVAIVPACEMSAHAPPVEEESFELNGPTITLRAGSGTQSGYDFHAQRYLGNSGGDLYFTGAPSGRTTWGNAGS